MNTTQLAAISSEETASQASTRGRRITRITWPPCRASSTNSAAAGTLQTMRCARISHGPTPRRADSLEDQGHEAPDQ